MKLLTIVLVAASCSVGRAGVIPTRYEDVYAEDATEIPTADSDSLDDAVAYQLPESVSTYANNWSDNYLTYKYHSLMHRPQADEEEEEDNDEESYDIEGDEDEEEDDVADYDVSEYDVPDYYEEPVYDEDADVRIREHSADYADDKGPIYSYIDREEPEVNEETELDEEAEGDDEIEVDEVVEETEADEDVEEEVGSLKSKRDALPASGLTIDVSDAEIKAIPLPKKGKAAASAVKTLSSNDTQTSNSTMEAPSNSTCVAILPVILEERKRLDINGTEAGPPPGLNYTDANALQKAFSNEGVRPVSCAMFGITIALAFCTFLL